MSLSETLASELSAWAERGLLRDPSEAGVRRRWAERGRVVDLCSNDYLGLSRADVSRETLEDLLASPVGAGASRLIQGTADSHELLERELANWVRLPAALLFSSGYAANVGALSALLGPDDLVVSDALNHASLIDGCRLSRARVVVVPHGDVAAVDRALSAPGRRKLVAVESYYSMDGDHADLRALRSLCDQHGAWLLVDEAHALGVYGERGAGRCVDSGVTPDVLVGTLGKAVGVSGAFVAGSPELRTWLWNRARSFVFSTATSPLISALCRVQRRRAEEPERRARLHALAERLRRDWASLPLVPRSTGPILPLMVGEERRAVALAERIRERGVLVQAVRAPTVAWGAARLRLTVTAALTDDDATLASQVVLEACRALP